jgi:hypothetical protein
MGDGCASVAGLVEIVAGLEFVGFTALALGRPAGAFVAQADRRLLGRCR